MLESDRSLFFLKMQELNWDVSRETRDQLDGFVYTLHQWQKAINLVSRTTLPEVWTRHLLDSAQAVVHIPRPAKSLVDLGSGAGFPGLIVAALRPELNVTLIEADARKGAFLAEAGRRMGLKKQPRIIVSRIESAAGSQADVVTARALAPLPQLLSWAYPHQNDAGICLFHKGKDWQTELADAFKTWDFQAKCLPSVTNRDAVLLEISRLSSKDLRNR